MLNTLGLLTVAYLAGSGLTTNTAVVGRGLVRAARLVASGRYAEAGVEAASTLAAPAVMSYAATAAFVMEAVEGAHDLLAPVLAVTQPELAASAPAQQQPAVKPARKSRKSA
jgi:hypothetical protein